MSLLTTIDNFLIGIGLLPKPASAIPTAQAPSVPANTIPSVQSSSGPSTSPMVGQSTTPDQTPSVSNESLSLAASVGIGSSTSAVNNVTGQVVVTGWVSLSGQPVPPVTTAGNIHASSDGTDGSALAAAANQYIATHNISASQESSQSQQAETAALNSTGPAKAAAPFAGAVISVVGEAGSLLGIDSESQPDQTQVPIAVLAAHNATAHGTVTNVPVINEQTNPTDDGSGNNGGDITPTSIPSVSLNGFLSAAVRSSLPSNTVAALNKTTPALGAAVPINALIPAGSVIPKPTPPVVQTTTVVKPVVVTSTPKAPAVAKPPYSY